MNTPNALRFFRVIPAALLIFLAIPPSADATYPDQINLQTSITSSTSFFQSTLMENHSVQKGSMLATLDGNKLRLIGHFGGLSSPWIQIDLYHGEPDQGGEAIKNLSITIPEGGGNRGGLTITIDLTDEQVNLLLTEQLHVSVRTLGERSHDLSGRINVLPTANPTLLESSFSYFWGGQFSSRGGVLAMLDDDMLRLVGFGVLDMPVYSVALYRGLPINQGEHLATIYLNFSNQNDSVVGFDHALPLSDEMQQDLLDGQLYLVVNTFSNFTVTSRLLSITNQAPEVALVSTPADGESILIGGANPTEAMDPETPLFELTFQPALDPDGHEVSYFWQVSRLSTFDQTASVVYDLGPVDTPLPFTVGAAAALTDRIRATSPVPIPVESLLILYHRMITTDGARYTLGPTSTTTFYRGAVIANEPSAEIPVRIKLRGNYPNPFNPTTTVVFDLPQQAQVDLDVYDIAGRRVLTVPEQSISAGSNRSIGLDAVGLPSGAYLYRITARTATEILVGEGRMTLLK